MSTARLRRRLGAAERVIAKEPFLLAVELVVSCDVVVCDEQEAARPTRGIGHRRVRARLHHVDDRSDQSARREVLAGAGASVGGVSFQQILVDVAFEIGVDSGPRLRPDQVNDQTPQLRGILDLVLRLPEDQPEQAGLAAEPLQ